MKGILFMWVKVLLGVYIINVVNIVGGIFFFVREFGKNF